MLRSERALPFTAATHHDHTHHRQESVMGFPILERPAGRLAFFAPPYEEFIDIDVTWRPSVLPVRGCAFVWWLADGVAQENEFQFLHDRPHSVPLFLVLPPPRHLARALPLLNYVMALKPRAVLPTSSVITAENLKTMLATPPENLAVAVSERLVERKLIRSESVRREVRRIFELAPEINSISRLARRLYTSRRTLGRHFLGAGLPVPCHWLQFARLMYVTVRLQNDPSSVFRIVSAAGYPDGFTMSNQMKRLLDTRPSELRDQLGWEWVVESWISMEAKHGGIDLNRYANVVQEYVGAAPLRARPFSSKKEIMRADLQHA
jgi:AraC-like DNA-binding protein